MSAGVRLAPWWYSARQPIKNASDHAVTIYGAVPPRVLLPGEEALFEWKDGQWKETLTPPSRTTPSPRPAGAPAR